MKTGKTLQELAIEIDRQFKTKKDYVASTGVMEMVPIADGVAMTLGDKGAFTVGDIAHDQIAEHTKIPQGYYDRMLREDRALLAVLLSRR